jgi:hypothetical protein
MPYPLGGSITMFRSKSTGAWHIPVIPIFSWPHWSGKIPVSLVHVVMWQDPIPQACPVILSSPRRSTLLTHSPHTSPLSRRMAHSSRPILDSHPACPSTTTYDAISTKIYPIAYHAAYRENHSTHLRVIHTRRRHSCYVPKFPEHFKPNRADRDLGMVPLYER